MVAQRLPRISGQFSGDKNKSGVETVTANPRCRNSLRRIELGAVVAARLLPMVALHETGACNCKNSVRPDARAAS